MKIKAKKLLSMLLACAIFFSISVRFDFTAKAAVGDDFYLYYEYLASDEVEIVGYEGEIDYLMIPDYLDNGAKVISIGFGALRFLDSLKIVVIPNTVTDICMNAFECCSGLEYVVLSDNLMDISPCAFLNCSNLYRIVSQSSDSLPESLYRIGEYAFSGCSSLINIQITSSVDLENGVFFGCNSLKSVIFEKPFFTVYNPFEGLSDYTTIRYTGSEESWKKCFHEKIWDKNVIYNCTMCDSYDEHESSWYQGGNSYFMCCDKCGELTYELPFKDLKDYGNNYFHYILYTSVYNEFIRGTNPPLYSCFSPTTSINRAMMVTILYRMAGEPYEDGRNPYKTSPFKDITNTNAYYYNPACWALKNGITTETTFKPFDDVSREQTAAFLFRYAKDNNALGDVAYKSVDLSSYPDYNNVSSWAVEALQWVNYNGMITGTQQGYINPQGATQRIHATKILYGFGKACNIGNF